MTQSVVESLQGLRDVQGVFGSFVLGRSGRVLCKDLPRLFDDRVFEEVGPRIVRLKEAFSGDEPGLDNVVIRYSEHKLHLRFLSASVLGVITGTGVNAATLKMALTLSSRRIEADLVPEPPGVESLTGPATLRSPKLPGHASQPPPPQPEPPPTSPEQRPRRAPILYRGRRIG